MISVLSPFLVLCAAALSFLGFVRAAGADTTDAALRERSLTTLRHELANTEGWVRVHAAEALIEHGQSAGLDSLYAGELVAATPPYRIGVRRVLACVAPGPERATHLAAIRAALHDPAGPDRVHAAETLAKLGAATSADTPVISAWLATADATSAAYLRWLRVQLSPDTQRAAEAAALAALLQSDLPAARLRAAYALTRLSNLAPDTVALLRMRATLEPAESPARAYVVAAAFVHLPRDSPERTELRRLLCSFLAQGTPGEQLEVAVILGRHGDRDDLTALVALLSSLHPDTRIGGASGLLHLLR